DSLGNTVSSTYDNKGRLDTMTDARGTVTKYKYDALNRLVTRIVDPTQASDPAGTVRLNLTTQYDFNALGQQVTVTEGLGTPGQRVTQYNYDLDGRVFQVVVDPSGLKLATTYTFDGLNDTLTVARGTVASPNQQVTQYVFDKLGRRTKQIDAAVGAGS